MKRTLLPVGHTKLLAAVGPLLVCCGAADSEPDHPNSRPRSSLFGLQRAELSEPLVTDRPDFTESTDTVPFGHVQWEGGYTFTYDREGAPRTRSHSAPETLIRVGFLENWELRLGLNGYSWTETEFDTATPAGRTERSQDWSQGADDLSFGVKWKFVEQQGFIPHLGVIVETSVPSGSAETTSGDVDPQVKLLWSFDLSERFALSGNVNVAVPTQDAHRFVQSAASMSLGVSLSERWGSYVEYFGVYPNTDGTDCAHYLNGGLTFQLTDNLQFDVRTGAGLNEEADDFFAGVGIAIRF